MSKLGVVYVFLKKRYFQSFKNRKDLERYQERCIKKHLKFVCEKSEYYKKMGLKGKELSCYPMMDKKKMIAEFDQLNTVSVNRDTAMEIAINGEKTRNFDENCKGITVGLSSGTSGCRGMFLVSKHEQNSWAGAILAKMLPKEHLFNHRIAFFLRANSNMYKAVETKAVTFEYFDTFIEMDKHIIRLNGYNPTILIAPPSALLQLAKLKKEKQLNINPEKIVSVAEVLEDSDREVIKEAFEQKIIHQIYQCTEGFLGCTCEYGHLHLNEDIVYVEKEYISNGRFVPIITDFKRTSQPMIRYRLNDVLIQSDEPCQCNSPMTYIKKIEGREDDIFIFDGLEGKKVIVYSDFIRRCMLFSGIDGEYRVVQHKDAIEIQLSNTPQNPDKIIKEFEKLAQDLKYINPQIRFGEYHVPLGKKMKRIERLAD